MSDKRLDEARDLLVDCVSKCSDSCCIPKTHGALRYVISILPPPPSLQDQEVAGAIKDFLFENCGHDNRDRNYDWCPTCVEYFVASALSDARVAGEQQHCDHCSADLNGVRHILCETDYRKFAGPKWWDAGHNSEIASDDRMAYDAGRVAGEQAERERCVEIVADFDDWEWCECSECAADASSHAVAIPTSLANIAAAIRKEPK